MWGINYLDVLAEENDAAQATIFDERLAKIMKMEIRSKVILSYIFMEFAHYMCCFPKTKTEKHLTCHSP